jgi:hypothetical protein
MADSDQFKNFIFTSAVGSNLNFSDRGNQFNYLIKKENKFI